MQLRTQGLCVVFFWFIAPQFASKVQTHGIDQIAMRGKKRINSCIELDTFVCRETGLARVGPNNGFGRLIRSGTANPLHAFAGTSAATHKKLVLENPEFVGLCTSFPPVEHHAPLMPVQHQYFTKNGFLSLIFN